ncbi:MAG: hypothetical protein E6772_08075 [Dysgonomonas sp.]|nr:hypothetical protein [Dysgonomonas sp.]
MAKSKRKSKARSRNFIILILIVGILGGMYYYLEIYMQEPGNMGSSEKQSEYILLENKDSTNYEAIVMYNYNVNINYVAKKFYKSNIFWPYIFIENQDEEAVKRNPLDIPKGVILKIPRLADNDINLIDSASVNKAKQLADSILNTTSAL